METGVLKQELLLLKALGSVVNHAAVVFTTYVTWNWVRGINITSITSLLFGWLNLTLWLNSFAVIIAQAVACFGLALFVTTKDPFTSAIIKSQWIPTPVAIALNKLVSRLGNVQTALSLTVAAVLHFISALLSFSFFEFDTSQHDGVGSNVLYASCLTLVYFITLILWDRDILRFPLIQRHRYFRIKQRIPGAAADALQVTLATLAVAAVFNVTTGHGIPAIIHPGTRIALTVFCWFMSGAILEVVFTERLRPDDYGTKDVLMAMTAALLGKNGPIMTDLALHDVAGVALDNGKASWRRVEVFRDETGARWKAVAEPCLDNVKGVTVELAAALPASRSTASTAGGSTNGSTGGAGTSAATKWNALPAVGSRGAISSSRQQILSLIAARARYQRVSLSVKALADFCVASATEDRLGVLQLVDPGLGHTLVTLLSALLATQQLAKQLGSAGRVSLGPWRGVGDGAGGVGQADAALLALQDVLTNAVYCIVETFGSELVKVVVDSKTVPVHGSASDVQRLLRKALANEL